MKKILELDPSNDQARKAIRRLEPLAEAKREKMKEEMIGKSINDFLYFTKFCLYPKKKWMKIRNKTQFIL